MRFSCWCLAGLTAFLLLPRDPYIGAQEMAAGNTITDTPMLLTGRPFTGIKFARRVRVLPDGKLQFLRNLRYPARIARDAAGRLMMQDIRSDDLAPECDHLDLAVPPVCPAWAVFVIDPVEHKVSHWREGEVTGHVAVDFPLSLARLNEAAESTGTLPTLAPDFSDEDGKMSTADLGERVIGGIAAHGVRWMLRYDVNRDGQAVELTRIHEVWTSAQMQIIVRVIDGDPMGEETVWGLEKISLSPEAALFRPPDDFKFEHRDSDGYAGTHHGFVDTDFEALHGWFSQ